MDNVENMGRVNYGKFLFDRKVEVRWRVKGVSWKSCKHDLVLDHYKMGWVRLEVVWIEEEIKRVVVEGILSSVYVDGKSLHGWKTFSVPFQNLNDKQKVNPIINFSFSELITSAYQKLEDNSSKEPAFYTGYFMVDNTHQLEDTFLSFRAWGKGVAFVNEFNIGRFWPSIGPQCNLYVPAPILRHGKNVVRRPSSCCKLQRVN
ncbi:unnamed protein product [Thlaspi arvense]|uniref:Beta-galactosidase galactose-binding domain-containing protein n=1 Tax=Thlaspi arvense TaxID=13288 RepID=A0AAU9RQR1_THLAR|nr:unnamed protein product [Thlaspi arvense]